MSGTVVSRAMRMPANLADPGAEAPAAAWHLCRLWQSCAAQDDAQAHGGDAFDIAIAWLVELLAEYVGVELLVFEVQFARTQPRFERLEKGIDPAHDRGPGVQDQRARGREPHQSLVHDAQ